MGRPSAIGRSRSGSRKRPQPKGSTYALDGIKRQPNTLDCHRLILWADETGNAAGMKQRLMDLYFTEGGDLTDREVLVQAAVHCGLDAAIMRRRLAADDDEERVEQDANSAKEAGIDGVPCFILGGRMAVQGAQAPEYLAQAIACAADEYVRRGRGIAARALTSLGAPCPSPQPHIGQSNCPRAKRNASTRMALAAIHEPKMRPPMRAQIHSRPPIR